MPRYCADIISLPPPHHHGRSRAGHRPTEIGRSLGIFHLATATLAIIVGVLPPAVGPDRTTIIRIMAELTHVLDHHGDAVSIALGVMATRRVIRAFPAEHDGAVGDVVAALAFLAEAVILQLQHGGEGKGVIGARE